VTVAGSSDPADQDGYRSRAVMYWPAGVEQSARVETQTALTGGYAGTLRNAFDGNEDSR
jgi:hypothetical protein